VTVNSPRALPAAELAAHSPPGVPAACFDSLAAALAAPAKSRRLVCGSLYLCGEALALLGAGGFEPSAQ
jgi:folylpolyglutamate synthase/dihydropteroate synthase